MTLFGLLILLVVLGFLFTNGRSESYFAPGISVTGLLLLLLLLWAFGVFGGGRHW